MKLFSWFIGLSLIISGCASSPAPTAETAAQKEKGQVLVIVSSESELALRAGKKYPTGYYFNELTVPARKLIEQGYELVFANPLGNPPLMDKHSDTADFFGKDLVKYNDFKRFHDEQLKDLKSPHKISQLISQGLDSYKGVFFPGGHAPMIDLLKNAEVRTVLEHFHQKGKPTALICHGPIALIGALPNSEEFVSALSKGKMTKARKLSKDWIYSNYRMTIFSTAEEKIAENSQLGGKMVFYPQDALKAAGGKVEVAKEWQSQAIRDRELITGQNPYSDERLVELFLEALAEKKN